MFFKSGLIIHKDGEIAAMNFYFTLLIMSLFTSNSSRNVSCRIQTLSFPFNRHTALLLFGSVHFVPSTLRVPVENGMAIEMSLDGIDEIPRTRGKRSQFARLNQ